MDLFSGDLFSSGIVFGRFVAERIRIRALHLCVLSMSHDTSAFRRWIFASRRRVGRARTNVRTTVDERRFSAPQIKKPRRSSGAAHSATTYCAGVPTVTGAATGALAVTSTLFTGLIFTVARILSSRLKISSRFTALPPSSVSPVVATFIANS